MRMLEYDSAAALERDLPRDLLRTYGNGTFLDAIEETEGALHARLGLEVPEVLADPGKDTHVLSFLQLRGVTNLRFKRHGREFKSGRLDREEFFRHAAERRDDLVQRAETAMVEAARDEIVRVQPIGSGLNPIREILVYVNEEGSLESRLLDPDKKRRYLPLLEALGYVAQKEGVIRPGPELEKFSVARNSIQGDPEFYMALLGDVLRRGYRDLRDALQVQHLVPIVRAANAYYWPSQRIGRPLEFRARDFESSLKRLHPSYRVSSVKLHNHLIEMAGADIVEKNGSIYTANDEVWTRYANQASEILA